MLAIWEHVGYFLLGFITCEIVLLFFLVLRASREGRAQRRRLFRVVQNRFGVWQQIG